MLLEFKKVMNKDEKDVEKVMFCVKKLLIVVEIVSEGLKIVFGGNILENKFLC